MSHHVIPAGPGWKFVYQGEDGRLFVEGSVLAWVIIVEEDGLEVRMETHAAGLTGDEMEAVNFRGFQDPAGRVVDDHNGWSDDLEAAQRRKDADDQADAT
jgi:hypothetical protein